MTEEENIREEIDEIVKKKKNKFLKSLDSNMYFKSVFSGDSLSFEWIDQIEFSCPYIDIVVRNPKLTLIKEGLLLFWKPSLSEKRGRSHRKSFLLLLLTVSCSNLTLGTNCIKAVSIYSQFSFKSTIIP